MSARTIIITAFFIAQIVLMIFLRPVRSLGVFEALLKLGSKPLRLKKILVKNLSFCALVRLKGGLIAPETASIHFLDQGQKIESGFGICSHGHLDDLLPNIFLAPILITLSTDR